MEYLAMMGFFGTIICFLQALLFERDDVANLLFPNDSTQHESENESQDPSSMQVLLLIVFTIFGYIYYAGMCCFLLISEAAFLNLSLLSSDLWSVGFRILQECILSSQVFFLSLITVASRVFAYQKAPSPIVKDKDGKVMLEGEQDGGEFT